MKPEFNFYVIFTIDIIKAADTWITLSKIKPKTVTRKNFTVTESANDEPEYYKTHRRYCGILSIDDLEKFISDCDFDDTCQTMGALTLEYGLLPAISFSAYAEDYTFNAYISPIFSDKTEAALGTLPENARPIAQEGITLAFDNLMNALKDYLSEPEKLRESIESAHIEMN